MLNEIQQVLATADLLYSEGEVERALDVMADAINQALADTNPLVLCVLNGGIIAAGKLIPRLNMPLNLDSINATRYQNQTSGGTIKWILKPATSLKDRTVLIIDDILDEGVTLAAIKAHCLADGAKAVYTAALVDKDLGCEKPIAVDFIGLITENRYLFGYGMDYKGYLRNAPGIYAVREKDHG
jgi:hypoxanthine phosphoribosyltransferase